MKENQTTNPLKNLEEAIKNRHLTNIVEWRAKHPKEPMTMFEQCACDLENQFRKVEVKFDAFKKQLQDLIKDRLDVIEPLPTLKGCTKYVKLVNEHLDKIEKLFGKEK